MKTETTWIVKRDDGEYLKIMYGYDYWSYGMKNADSFTTKKYAIEKINTYNLKNCKPQKIEIREVR